MKKITNLFILLFIVQSASATAFDTVTPPPGNGSDSTPYLISTLEHLRWLSKQDTTLANLYVMTADIDASPTSTISPIWSDSGFRPIGFGFGKHFDGEFNGRGHSIKNLFINRPNDQYIGLFGTANGLIESLTVVNCNITGSRNVGGIAGSNLGNIYYCSTNGTVYGGSNVGGIAGYNVVQAFSAGTVFSCHSNCNVLATGNTPLGTNNGDFGGIVGDNYISAIIQNCYFTGIVSTTYTKSGSSYYSSYAGGIAGASISSIYECYNTGSISGYTDIGGIAGYASGYLVGCYSTGTVTGDNYTGGIVGYYGNNGVGQLNNCYSAGKISGDTITKCTGAIIGIFIGSSNLLIKDLFFNVQTTQQNHGLGKNSIVLYTPVGLTTSQMKKKANFTGFFTPPDSNWTICEDSTYPGFSHFNNAPFAFTDTFTITSHTFPLSELLLNDYDIENSQKNLVLKVKTLNKGVVDNTTGILTDTSSSSVDTITLTYRVGEILPNDTLWGNIATSLIIISNISTHNSKIKTPLSNVVLTSSNSTVQYSLPKACNVSFRLFNVQGKLIRTFIDEEQSSGYYQIPLHTADLSRGCYLMDFTAGSFAVKRKMSNY
jgi:hypothetical protein